MATANASEPVPMRLIWPVRHELECAILPEPIPLPDGMKRMNRATFV